MWNVELTFFLRRKQSSDIARLTRKLRECANSVITANIHYRRQFRPSEPHESGTTYQQKQDDQIGAYSLLVIFMFRDMTLIQWSWNLHKLFTTTEKERGVV